jgi:hypothetical protein
MDSLLLSTNNYNHSTLNDTFLKRVYNYYYMKGHIPIIIDKCSYIFINIFLIFFINIITNCIDYNAIYKFGMENNTLTGVEYTMNKDIVSIFNFINFKYIIPKSPYLVICLSIYFIYLICMIINCINEIKLVLEMKTIYKNKFNIKTSELEYISWNKVVDKLRSVYSDPNINIYTVSNRILRKENILINIYKYKLPDLPAISKLLEWNFIFCFVDTLFSGNENDSISADTLIINKVKYRNKVKNRCILVGFINLISIPFVLYIVVIYMLIKDGEQFYNNPELSFNKQINVCGYWKLRYYNELIHLFDKRIYKIKEVLNKINDFHNDNLKSKELLLRLVSFILSSIFIILIVLSFYNDKILLGCSFIGNISILWIIGMLGTILAINRKFIFNSSNKLNNYHDEEEILFTTLKEYIPIINPVFFEYKNRKKLLKIMNKMYCSKIYFIFIELIYICISPYYLYKWYYNCDKYIDAIVDNLENHFILGKIVDKSNMTNINYLSTNSHCYYSYTNFIKNNPEWKYNMVRYNELNTRVNLNEESFLWSNSQNEIINDSHFELNNSYL